MSICCCSAAAGDAWASQKPTTSKPAPCPSRNLREVGPHWLILPKNSLALVWAGPVPDVAP
eukprot:3590419-Pyramimonas_sp.AAC.1